MRRDRRLTRLFADSLPENPRLLDLAAGTGANLRYLAPRIGRPGQRWVLADHDRVLLDAVAGEMARWPHQAPPLLECRRIDLVHDLGSLDPADFDGIVATALFDLVSGGLGQTLHRMAGPGSPACSAHPQRRWPARLDARRSDDADMRGWIEAHQATDKGFGPALGPSRPGAARRTAQDHGYDVFTEKRLDYWTGRCRDAPGADRRLPDGSAGIAPAHAPTLIDG